MAVKTIALGMLLLATPALALPQEAAPQAAQDANSFDLARVKIAGCQGERFDFTVGEGAGGTKVSLCGKAGASKDEVAALLESAIRELQSSDRLQAAKRDALVAQIQARIAEIRSR